MKINHPSLEQIPQLRVLWREAFGDTDEFLDAFFQIAFSPMRCLCATIDYKIAAAAYWFDCNEYAYIYAVATAKPYQKLGICHALMAEIHEILKQQGYRGSILVPGNESLRQFYSKMGYQNFGGIREWECTASTPLPVQKISSAEFASLRRMYLPQDSVIQEGAVLSLLSYGADFYRGNDFLLCATKNGNHLQGLELLGNTDAAAGIVSTLGAKIGCFRTSGDAPFAMYHPLNEKKSPSYFSFALD